MHKLHEGQHNESKNDVPPLNETKIEEDEREVSSMDLSKKVPLECPLDQYRAFADIPNSSIPYPLPSKMPKLADEPESIPITQISSEPLFNGIIDQTKLTNGSSSLEYSSSHHKHKKRKSHKRRHSHSPSSNDKQPSGKKHKKKHKHRDHDEADQPKLLLDEQQPVDQPRIKIKFRAILQTAGDDKKPPKFLWHVPNEQDNNTEIAVENGSNVAPQNLTANQVPNVK